MEKKDQASERKVDRTIVKLGSARRHTQATIDATFPELVGDKTQRMGG